MSINWKQVQREIYPMQDYEVMPKRWAESLAYPFVRDVYNFTPAEIASYAQRLLGGDTRSRYTDYLARLSRTFNQLQLVGVKNLMDMTTRLESREEFEAFSTASTINAYDLAAGLKFLIYWFIPMKKPLSGLVGHDPTVSSALKILREMGVRSNLDMLQQGITPAVRKKLAKTGALPIDMINDLVNRADFSRMPWASRATISNIIGAGYRSLASLAGADPKQLYADFFRYGEAIGKNLKLGNEIDSSYRIAQIIPVVLRDG